MNYNIFQNKSFISIYMYLFRQYIGRCLANSVINRETANGEATNPKAPIRGREGGLRRLDFGPPVTIIMFQNHAEKLK